MEILLVFSRDFLIRFADLPRIFSARFFLPLEK
jgi:hypothetical protein